MDDSYLVLSPGGGGSFFVCALLLCEVGQASHRRPWLVVVGKRGELN